MFVTMIRLGSQKKIKIGDKIYYLSHIVFCIHGMKVGERLISLLLQIMMETVTCTRHPPLLCSPLAATTRLLIKPFPNFVKDITYLKRRREK